MAKITGAVTFKDEVWQRLRRTLLLDSPAAQQSHVKVGVIKSKGGGESVEDGSITMTELAAIHEFGSPAAGIPERSFIRSTFERKAGEMGKLCGRLATQFVQGMTMSRALGLLGAWGVAQVKETIRERATVGPEDQANAASTIAKKGSDLPLVDTGRLINAIQWLVSLGYNRDEKGRFTGGRFDA